MRLVLVALSVPLLLMPAMVTAQSSRAVHLVNRSVRWVLQEPVLNGGQAPGPDQVQAPGQGQEPEPVPQPGQEQPSRPAVDASSNVTTVHGVVRNAATGQPLPRALVRIEGDASAGTLTDGEGRFEFSAVPVGPQTLRLLKPGFHDRPYATEEIGYQAEGPAHSVLVAAQMPELVFALTPTCSIHGNVDLSTGDPAQGITVTLVKQVVRNGRAVWALDATTKTNGDGAYRFASLPNGTYVVYTQPALESEPAVTAVAPGSAGNIVSSGYPSVFYPDAGDFRGAARIRLASGEQAQANLSLTLEPFHAVTATAYFPNGRQFVPNAPTETGFDASFQSAFLLDASGRRLPYTGQYDMETRTIQASLPDGIYTLVVSVAANEPSVPVAGNAQRRGGQRPAGFTGYVDFSVAGQAVTNLRIPLALTPSWPVRLRAERNTLRPAQVAGAQGLQTQVTISTTDAGETPAEGAGGSASAEAAGTDLLDLNSAGFGSYWISAQVNDRSLCVESFTAGGTNLAREPLNLSPSSTAPLMEMTLRDDCGVLALELPPAQAAFLPGDEPFYTVYVVPDFDTTADLPPMTIHPSSGAMLTLEGLTPGNYHVYVFDRPVRLEYRNPAALAELKNPGQAVTLSPGATSELILDVTGH